MGRMEFQGPLENLENQEKMVPMDLQAIANL